MAPLIRIYYIYSICAPWGHCVKSSSAPSGLLNFKGQLISLAFKRGCSLPNRKEGTQPRWTFLRTHTHTHTRLCICAFLEALPPFYILPFIFYFFCSCSYGEYTSAPYARSLLLQLSRICTLTLNDLIIYTCTQNKYH